MQSTDWHIASVWCLPAILSCSSNYYCSLGSGRGQMLLTLLYPLGATNSRNVEWFDLRSQSQQMAVRTPGGLWVQWSFPPSLPPLKWMLFPLGTCLPAFHVCEFFLLPAVAPFVRILHRLSLQKPLPVAVRPGHEQACQQGSGTPLSHCKPGGFCSCCVEPPKGSYLSCLVSGINFESLPFALKSVISMHLKTEGWLIL